MALAPGSAAGRGLAQSLPGSRGLPRRRVPEVRVLGEGKEALGVMSLDEVPALPAPLSPPPLPVRFPHPAPPSPPALPARLPWAPSPPTLPARPSSPAIPTRPQLCRLRIVIITCHETFRKIIQLRSDASKIIAYAS